MTGEHGHSPRARRGDHTHPELGIAAPSGGHMAHLGFLQSGLHTHPELGREEPFQGEGEHKHSILSIFSMWREDFADGGHSHAAGGYAPPVLMPPGAPAPTPLPPVLAPELGVPVEAPGIISPIPPPAPPQDGRIATQAGGILSRLLRR